MEIMEFKGFKARIMKADRLIGSGVHNLPPGTGIDVLPVDAFEQPLSHWIKGAGSYVVPVDSDWGLWFDFTLNDQMNTAVLLSVKGMNPVTGQRTNGFALEKYEEKCPIHDIKFSDGLFCEKCNYKWPYQNYIAYPNILWWDGFRSSDGKVRQFFFTEDLARSIPELVIGKEDTIPAFGFAFFRPKVLRQTSSKNYRSLSSGCFVSPECFVSPGKYGVYANNVYYTSTNCSKGLPGIQGLCGPKGEDEIKTSGGIICSDNSNNDKQFRLSESSTYCAETLSFIDDNKERSFDSIECKKSRSAEVGVGAGAEISQDLKCDPLKVSDWENEPASIMRLYFVFVEQFEEIKSKGLKDLVGLKEGYLEELPVG